ncbi:hypothetical protein Lesp02_52260 [Lentzea sp. NBRC 105346]|uniref:hypothetical protein n=1 Tax=Lentzea sp. NBRC 105346 TaxID=3032205 RepID=UPI0024A2A08E|nr:hypothetical protein [Lentzea sp. NBRC 105346]GLZ33038.1 hypothetical protein Lesp02_52260 [Lentzea sp. NBRC 105346]
MTGTERTPLDPPWSLDLLADLHAGVLDERTEAELRPRVMADPDARAVLEALDATVMDLHNLPPIPMPREVADRIDAALAAEARPAAPVVSLDEARKRRNRRLGLGGGVLAAAAAAIGIALVVAPQNNTADQPPGAQQTQTSDKPVSGPPLAVKEGEFAAAVPEVLKAQNYGPLDNQDRLAGCLKGGGITSTAKPLGISPVSLKGKTAVMAILPGGAPGQFRIVVLDPDTCGPDNPQGVIADTTIKPTR